VLGQREGAGADEDDFMVTSRELAKEVRNEGKEKRKKHPPTKNGERPAVAARAREGELRPKETTENEARPSEVTVVDAPPVVRPAAIKTKLKVVKF